MKRSKNFEKRKKFIMELLGDPLYKPMRLREIASLLQLDKSEKKELFDVLDELCAQGKAEVDNKGRYSKISGKRRDRRKNKEALKQKSRSVAVKEENAERRIMRNIVSPRRTEPSWRELLLVITRALALWKWRIRNRIFLFRKMTREAPCIRIRCRSLYGTDIKRETSGRRCAEGSGKGNAFDRGNIPEQP